MTQAQTPPVASSTAIPWQKALAGQQNSKARNKKLVLLVSLGFFSIFLWFYLLYQISHRAPAAAKPQMAEAPPPVAPQGIIPQALQPQPASHPMQFGRPRGSLAAAGTAGSVPMNSFPPPPQMPGGMRSAGMMPGGMSSAGMMPGDMSGGPGMMPGGMSGGPGMMPGGMSSAGGMNSSSPGMMPGGMSSAGGMNSSSPGMMPGGMNSSSPGIMSGGMPGAAVNMHGGPSGMAEPRPVPYAVPASYRHQAISAPRQYRHALSIAGAEPDMHNARVRTYAGR